MCRISMFLMFGLDVNTVNCLGFLGVGIIGVIVAENLWKFGTTNSGTDVVDCVVRLVFLCVVVLVEVVVVDVVVVLIVVV